MENKILEEAGLTKNELTVYKALLQLGSTTAGPLTKKSGIHRSRVYESLNRLIEKGLVSYKIKANRKYFQAQNPEALVDFIEEKKQKIQSIVPELKAMQIFKPEKQEANVFEGYKREETRTDCARVLDRRSPDGTVFFRAVTGFSDGPLQITHDVDGRAIYAQGTLDAIRYLQKKIEAGEKGKVYSMIDVLKGE